MKKLSVNQHLLTSYKYLSHKEIKVKNRKNALLCTNLIFSNLRKEQGLLIARLERPKIAYYVLLASLIETLKMGDFEYHLSVTKQTNEFKTSGLKYLYKVDACPFPKLYYNLGTIHLIKSFVLDPQQNLLFIRYKLKEAPVDVKFEINPLLAFREINKLSVANRYANSFSEKTDAGYAIGMYSNFKPIYFMSNKNMDYTQNGYWIRGFRYLVDDSEVETEDLFVPGKIHFSLSEGESFILTIGLEEIPKKLIKKEFENVKNNLLASKMRN